MSFRAESPVEGTRRVSSFRIDDILAHEGGDSVSRRKRSSSSVNPAPSSPQVLSFGVEQILKTRAHSDTDDATLSYLGASFAGASAGAHESCTHLSPSVWCSPYLTAHLHPYLYSPLRAGCEACYSSFSYSGNAFTALYSDCNASFPSKSQLAIQALPGQPKPRKPRRPWTRAVFSNLQRKGLEKRFQVQKYLTKADRHQLASMLGLSDNQVKVWFQNRRMKWRQEARETGPAGSSEESEK